MKNSVYILYLYILFIFSNEILAFRSYRTIRYFLDDHEVFSSNEIKTNQFNLHQDFATLMQLGLKRKHRKSDSEAGNVLISTTQYHKQLLDTKKSFQQTILALSNQNKWKEALAVLDEMKMQNICENGPIYTAVISACAREGQTTKCLSLLEQMELHGIQPPSSLYNLVMRELLSKKEWSQVLFLFFQTKHNLKPGCSDYRLGFGYALRACEHLRASQIATQLHSELLEKDQKALDGLLSVIYFRILAKAKQYKLAYKNLGRALEASAWVNLALVNYAMVVCAKNSDSNQALAILQLAVSKGLTVDHYTYGAAVDACARTGDENSAAQVFEIAQRNSVIPSLTMVNSMLHCYHHTGSWENALNLLKHIKEGPVKPDKITYSTVMYNIAKHGNSSLLIEFLKEMNDTALIPDSRACTTILCNLSKRGHGKVAWEFLSLMGEIGVPRDAIACSATIAASDIEGNPQLCIQGYEKMQELGHIADSITHSMVLNALKKVEAPAEQICQVLLNMWAAGSTVEAPIYSRIFALLAKKGETKLIRKMINEMSLREIEPSESVYTSLVVSLYKRGKLRQSLEEVKRLRKQGKPVKVAAYTSVISGCRQHKAYSLALDIFNELKLDPERSPTLITYNALISVLACSGEMNTAEKIFKEMQVEGFVPDVRTYHSMILGYSHLKKHSQVLSTLSQMKKEGIDLDLSIFNEALRALESSGNLEYSLNLLQEMRDKNVSPDKATYESLLNNCAKSTEWKKSLEILLQMQQKDGITPSATCYSAAIQACENGGEWRASLNLLLQMIKNELQPDTTPYNAVISACTTANEWQMALKLFESMLQSGIVPDRISFLLAVEASYKGRQWQKALNVLLMMHRAGFSPNPAAISEVIESLEEAQQFDKAVYVYDEFVMTQDKSFDLLLGEVDLRGFSAAVSRASIRSALRRLLQKYVASGNNSQNVKDFSLLTGTIKTTKMKFKPNLNQVTSDLIFEEFVPPLKATFTSSSLSGEHGSVQVEKKNLQDWLENMITPQNGISPAQSYGSFNFQGYEI